MSDLENMTGRTMVYREKDNFCGFDVKARVLVVKDKSTPEEERYDLRILEVLRDVGNHLNDDNDDFELFCRREGMAKAMVGWTLQHD